MCVYYELSQLLIKKVPVIWSLFCCTMLTKQTRVYCLQKQTVMAFGSCRRHTAEALSTFTSCCTHTFPAVHISLSSLHSVGIGSLETLRYKIIQSEGISEKIVPTRTQKKLLFLAVRVRQ